MFSNLLALYDLSPASLTALKWTLKLGERFRSRVHVLHVLERGAKTSQSEEISCVIRTDIDKELRKISQESPGGRLEKIDVQVSPGRPVTEILKTIEVRRPDLVVVGTHGRTGLKHVLLGSVAEKIVRHSPAPTLVAREIIAWPPKKMVLPIDIFESSEESLAFAQEFRRFLPVAVSGLYVVEPPVSVMVSPEMMSVPIPIVDEKTLRKEAEAKFREVSGGHPSFPMETSVVVGPAADQICRAARESQADMIIMPSHGRKGLSRLLMGSVAEQVVRYAPCSVLTYHPEKTARARRESLAEIGVSPENDKELGGGD